MQRLLPTHHSQFSSFTAWTTRVSNPVCSPRFRASVSVRPRLSPSPLMFFPISTHFTATPEIPLPSISLESTRFRRNSQVKPRDFTSNLYQPPTRPLRPVIPINACTLCITAAAGTELAGAYSAGTVIVMSYSLTTFLPHLKCFTTRRPSSHTRHRWIRVSPIVQDSPLLPPVGVWAVSQSQCGWSSSQTSYGSSPW